MLDLFDQAWVWVQANQGLAGTLGTVGAAGVAALAFVTGFFKRSAQPQITINTPPPVEQQAIQPAQQIVKVEQTPNTVLLTIDQYKADLQDARDEVLAQIPDASGDQLQLLTSKRDEFESRLNNIEPAFEAAKARIEELESIIEREGNLLGAEELEQAETALANGDFDAAEALLIRIEDQGDQEVKRTARAAFGRGKIAEEQVRWHDAADHYAKAARLDPTYETLEKAGGFFWRSGRYPEALRTGQDLLALSKREHGDEAPETATALNDLALWHKNIGQYDHAEPLYRQAIEIDKATIGQAHPDFAIRLNNLAELLQNMGRYDESEPLYRQAIEINKATIGETHPDHAMRLNNLAGLLQNMGRYDEAEPLYRQAIEIDKATIGETHPEYAKRLNNLAALLLTMGRYDEAEPLFRQAIEIDKATIGETHPSYAIRLNNLAGLLRDMGRFDEAKPNFFDSLSIFRTALDDDHPNTKQVAGNYARLLRAHFPDDPALADLQAIFGEDVGLE